MLDTQQGFGSLDAARQNPAIRRILCAAFVRRCSYSAMENVEKQPSGVGFRRDEQTSNKVQ